MSWKQIKSTIFSENKKKKIFTFFTLTLLFGALIFSFFTATFAADIQTTAYIGVSPNPVQVDQELLVSLWLTPAIPSEYVYHDLTVEFTKPDGSIEVVGPLDIERWGTGVLQFDYVPDQVGTWQVKLDYAGQDVIEGNTYLASSSSSQEFTVQSDPIPPWIYTELPTSYTYWGRPINSENREWNVYAGDWFQSGYNASMTNFNPYTTAPNTPHILWSRQTAVSGLVGGKYNGTGYSDGSNVNIILAGLVYYKALDGVHCIDAHTGEELWVNPDMNPSMGMVVPQQEISAGSAMMAELWEIGEEFVKYDPFTGVEILRVPDALHGIYSEPYFYSYDNGRLITWRTDNRVVEMNASLAEINSFEDLIVSNVSCAYDFDLIWGDVGVTINRWPEESAAIDLTTGETIWSKTLPIEESPVGATSVGNGKIFVAGEGMAFRAYDLYNGDKLWTSETAEYPWGAFWANYSAVAYDNLYGLSADGNVYCFDTQTGEMKWNFTSGISYGETPYDTWAFTANPVVADGKIYVSSSEPTSIEPKPIGNRLFCLNATTGDQLWRIDFAGGVKALGEGMLLATNEYDGVLYCFGRGRTSVDVMVSPAVATQGSTVLIEGYVWDQSPGVNGEPAVGNTDMDRWMEYLYMQRPCPTEVAGVPVQIRVIQDETGSKIDLGFAKTDLYGHFSFEYIPPLPGVYTVAARFLGNDPYFSSWEATGLTVGEATTPILIPEPETPPDYTLLLVVLIIAVSITIVVSLLNLKMLRKQNNRVSMSS